MPQTDFILLLPGPAWSRSFSKALWFLLVGTVFRNQSISKTSTATRCLCSWALLIDLDPWVYSNNSSQNPGALGSFLHFPSPSVKTLVPNSTYNIYSFFFSVLQCTQNNFILTPPTSLATTNHSTKMLLSILDSHLTWTFCSTDHHEFLLPPLNGFFTCFFTLGSP